MFKIAPIRLSVSCIGSNGLKRARSERFHATFHLSVSCIGSNGLKLHRDGTAPYSRYAFSILYRIEWVETIRHIVSPN